MNGNPTQSTWNEIASLYEQRFMDLPIYNDSYDYLVMAINKPDATLLDIGCGPGNILRYLSRQQPGLRLSGIDFAPNMIELAARNNPAATFQVLDCRDIGSIATHFDGIICGFCIPYLTVNETEKFLADVYQLLYPNGVLYLSFVAGDPEQSGWHTGSSGHQMYFHYYRSEVLLQHLAQLGLLPLQRFDIPYPLPDGSEQTHVIFIVQKADLAVT